MHDLRPAGTSDRDGVRDPVPAQRRQPRPGQVPRPYPVLRRMGVRAPRSLTIAVELVSMRPGDAVPARTRWRRETGIHVMAKRRGEAELEVFGHPACLRTPMPCRPKVQWRPAVAPAQPIDHGRGHAPCFGPGQAAVTREERRSITAARIAVGRLPQPRWVTVTQGTRATGSCDGCGEVMVLSDRAFKVVLHRAISLQFHDECFDVYN